MRIAQLPNAYQKCHFFGPNHCHFLLNALHAVTVPWPAAKRGCLLYAMAGSLRQVGRSLKRSRLLLSATIARGMRGDTREHYGNGINSRFEMLSYY